MYAKHYTRFNASGVLHFGSHSHHWWPDVTRDAQLRAWDDAAALTDRKWAQKVFAEVIPTAQGHVARQLELADPTRVVFAPNTHECVARLFSCFAENQHTNILTTDAEYHSAMWQMRRWNALPNVTVTRVPVEPFATFADRFCAAAAAEQHDMVLFSQVFFGSGFAVHDVEGIVDAVRDPHTMVVIDGYHGFMAKPTSLARLQHRAFYLAGGYKYAQAGEGACFLTVPTTVHWHPYDIGWFSMFAHLEEKLAFDAPIDFGNDASQYWGATFDPSGLYRFNAAQDLFIRENMTVANMDAYVMSLQQYFLVELARRNISWVSDTQLVSPRDLTRAGHFLTFRMADAAEKQRALDERNVIVDNRSDILRIGFAVYHNRDSIDRLLDIMTNIPA